jgi:hypothetical protein
MARLVANSGFASSQDLADLTRHVIGCRFTQDTRVHKAMNDAAGIIQSQHVWWMTRQTSSTHSMFGG